ncbi:hypothetical protein ACHHYP_20365 [Achlya hypogyna]|uniref:Transmembrane protein n=1 Tax=Achlya hypogyna TaxID=1202772 RepID=A0A1V9YPF7_ACHHY|nr:hypothetical protein ACHHYP_20365 [Achlya hypogyna]
MLAARQSVPPFASLTWFNPCAVRRDVLIALHVLLASMSVLLFHRLRPDSAPPVLLVDGILLTVSISTMGQILVFLVINMLQEYSLLRRKLALRSAAVAPLPAARNSV